MSEEEMMGRLKMIQDQLSTVQTTLDRIEDRQIKVKSEIESDQQGSFGTVGQ